MVEDSRTSDAFCSHGILSNGCVPQAEPLALVTEKVTASVRQALAVAGWSVISVETITSNHPSVVEERWRDNYSKLHLFSLQVLPRAWPRVARSLRHPAVQEYDVVMFIDADAVVLGDLQVAASSFQYFGFTDPAPLLNHRCSLHSPAARLSVLLSTSGCPCFSTRASWCLGPIPRCICASIAIFKCLIPFNALTLLTW